MSPEKNLIFKRFDQYISETTSRLNNLNQFFHQAIQETENIDHVNQKLTEANRPDLIIHNRFDLWKKAQSRQDLDFSYTDHLPNYNNFWTLTEFNRSKPTVEEILSNPKTPLCYHRLYTLFPDFLISTIKKLKENIVSTDHYEAEIFIHYQLMSRLIDVNDDKYSQTKSPGYLSR